MMRLAFRNLFHSRVRLIVSVGGVALALLLILSLDAIMAGIERQVTAYIESAGADVWVSQENVRNMHMASSSLPETTAGQVRSIPGVASATPIWYLTAYIEIGAERNTAYIIGLPADPAAGGPWQMVAGKAWPDRREIIIDQGVAERSGAAIGKTVKILGEEFTIAGLSEGTASATGGSVAFISKKDWDRLQSGARSISFVLVKVADGQTPAIVAARIESQVNKVTAQTRDAFAAQERQVVSDMSTDLITIMDLVGFLIGSAVMALTVYTATLARRAEYGVLKALGARNEHLYYVVVGQSLLSVLLGFTLGLGFTLLLSALMPFTGLPLALDVTTESLLKAGGVSLVLAAIAAMLPIKQIAGLDPALVFRGR
jgi:putative ABC transport system permease protein